MAKAAKNKPAAETDASTQSQPQSPPQSPPQSFEDSLGDLEEIVFELENGTLGLEESLAAYEKAMSKLKSCYAKLDNAQRRVELLKDLAADGSVESEPFDEAETDLETKRTSRSRRRSTGS
jgi:exodeoxyribonuclease VII small subunit